MQELGPENVKPGLNRLPGETWGALGQWNEGSRQSYRVSIAGEAPRAP